MNKLRILVIALCLSLAVAPAADARRKKPKPPPPKWRVTLNYEHHWITKERCKGIPAGFVTDITDWHVVYSATGYIPGRMRISGYRQQTIETISEDNYAVPSSKQELEKVDLSETNNGGDFTRKGYKVEYEYMDGDDEGREKTFRLPSKVGKSASYNLDDGGSQPIDGMDTKRCTGGAEWKTTHSVTFTRIQ
jgi:hypothetical protein